MFRKIHVPALVFALSSVAAGRPARAAPFRLGVTVDVQAPPAAHPARSSWRRVDTSSTVTLEPWLDRSPRPGDQ